MRQVILDTETTGLSPERGHRIIEIGCVELCERQRTQRIFHQYINPERDSEPGALEVHGLTSEFLRDKPLFAEIAQEFVAFISGAEVIIHNAAFDLGFLNRELSLLGQNFSGFETYATVVDTLQLARELFPGQRNSLDALCKRFDVDNSARNLHGALLDAELLADVYLALTSGQGALSFDDSATEEVNTSTQKVHDVASIRVVRASQAEYDQHAIRMTQIAKVSGKPCDWIGVDSK